MNHYAYVMMALDIARERMWEAERHSQARAIETARPPRTARIRRLAARFLSAVSRAAASAATRLDARLADDLRRSLAPAD